ncbi:hypothetical protein [Neptunomonas concharum]|nr:hypothetical protein [Neptunomonas concharum]
MFGIDKYSLISFAPSIAVVVGCVALVVIGVPMLKKAMAADEARANRDAK